MAIHRAVKATLVTLGVLAGAVAALIVLYLAAIVLVVLLGLWAAARVAGAAARFLP